MNRENCGKAVSITGIILNVVLAAGKITVGALFGVISVLADGLNNLSDCGSSLVSLISFKLAAKPADKEHPYGHSRIEYVAAMAVAFIILVVAFELGKEAVTKIISPAAAEFSYITIGVLAASILVKGFMFFFDRAFAKKLNSDVLKAAATDSVSDCVATSVVLIGVVITRFTGVNLDGYAGVLVALFVFASGIGVLKETMSKLIGQAPDPELIADIKTRIFAHKEVLGVHDISVYSYGPDKYYASVHIELDASVNVMESHEIVDAIEQEFATETNVSLTGHLDPIVVGDPEVDEMREKVYAIVASAGESFTAHDFRMVKGVKRTNLIFEVAIPFEEKRSEAEIKELIVSKIAELGENYFPVIHVEKQL